MVGCDGCGRTLTESYDGEEPEEIEIESSCPDCGYSVCEDCSVHHSRGTCYCPASNMGNSYCSMGGAQWYFGARGGTQYRGPFKCEAQIAMEHVLLYPPKPYLTDCSYCAKPGATNVCTRCKSVVYCGMKCQRAHWKLGHKAHCGSYLPSAAWGHVSAELQRYFDEFGRFPAARPPPKARKPASEPLESAAPGCAETPAVEPAEEVKMVPPPETAAEAEARAAAAPTTFAEDMRLIEEVGLILDIFAEEDAELSSLALEKDRKLVKDCATLYSIAVRYRSHANANWREVRRSIVEVVNRHLVGQGKKAYSGFEALATDIAAIESAMPPSHANLDTLHGGAGA